MDSTPIPPFVKSLEARIALALAKAAKGLVSANHMQVTNAATVGPAVTISFSSLIGFKTQTGVVRVEAYATVAAGTAVAGDEVRYSLLRDGAVLTAAPTAIVNMVTATSGPTAFASLAWFDAVTPGSTHTYGLQMSVTNGSGHTIEIPFNTAPQGGFVGVLMTDWPG